MAVFSVFEPPQGDLDIRDHAARFAFVRDGFSWSAFLFGPLWMLRHRMWLSLFLYVLIVGGLLFVAARLGLPVGAIFAIMFIVAVFVGLESGTLRRWKLARSKWRDLGVVVADDLQSAERRFFDRWFEAGSSRATSSPAAAPPYARYAMASRSDSPGIIGSFPEPGGQR